MTDVEIIVALAEKVMGWEVFGEPYPGPGQWAYSGTIGNQHLEGYIGGYHVPQWNPLESIADAWIMVEELQSRGIFLGLDAIDVRTWAANLTDRHASYRMEGPSAQRAICLAALATIEVEA